MSEPTLEAALAGVLSVNGREQRRATAAVTELRLPAAPMKKWRLKRTRQCAKCPWRVDVDPQTIPNGYSVEKHRGLSDTIAEPGSMGQKRAMACHESHDAHCLGWLINQLGPGNNIGLRLSVMGCANISAVRLIGEQHERFEDTLPVESRR